MFGVSSVPLPRPNSRPRGAVSAPSRPPCPAFLPPRPATCAPSAFMSWLNFELPLSTMGLPVLIERLTPS